MSLPLLLLHQRLAQSLLRLELGQVLLAQLQVAQAVVDLQHVHQVAVVAQVLVDLAEVPVLEVPVAAKAATEAVWG